jgi:hypothetical protein
MKSSKLLPFIVVAVYLILLVTSVFMLFAWAQTNNVYCGIAAFVLAAVPIIAANVSHLCMKCALYLIDLMTK